MYRCACNQPKGVGGGGGEQFFAKKKEHAKAKSLCQEFVNLLEHTTISLFQYKLKKIGTLIKKNNNKKKNKKRTKQWH